jgi:type I restriction enzyme S subunit
LISQSRGLGDVYKRQFNSSSAKWIPKGSLVMALAGQGRTKGMVAQLGIDTTCNQSMAAIIPAERLAARYLYYWLEANYENIRNMAGGDLRDGLNLEMLGNIPCPIPEIKEQDEISNFLDKEINKIDSLIDQSKSGISLLDERRSALISAAVTGQIDVRNYQPKEVA